MQAADKSRGKAKIKVVLNKKKKKNTHAEIWVSIKTCYSIS